MGPSPPLYCDVCGAFNEMQAALCSACHHPLLIDQTPIAAHLLSHTLFKGRYRIISKIGSGGFGSVYNAIDLQHRLVAIKEVSLPGLHPRAVSEATSAFQREVSLLSQLAHPSLPRLYEHFRGAGHWYLVMDFIDGETLEQYQERAVEKRLLLSEILDIGIQLCTVLEYLHNQQPPIIFRDLKPANIMRTPKGRIYLIDFGIARFFKPGQAKDTVALGSLGYAAPEQYGKAQTTPQADIYSLGVVLYQLLTAKDPSEAPFLFPPLYVNSYSSLTDFVRLLEQMVEMEVNKRPANISLVKQELQRVANVWKAAMMHFWRPGPQHIHLARSEM
jgi:serine/threonine protein kinase